MNRCVVVLLALAGIAGGAVLMGGCRKDAADDLPPLVVDTDVPLLLDEPSESERASGAPNVTANLIRTVTMKTTPRRRSGCMPSKRSSRYASSATSLRKSILKKSKPFAESNRTSPPRNPSCARTATANIACPAEPSDGTKPPEN